MESKATGPDGISNKMLKAVAKEASVPLNILFNRSFRQGKIYKYLEVFKCHTYTEKGDSSDPSNFRPVCLLSNIAKLQERIVFKNGHISLWKMIYCTNISQGFYQIILQLTSWWISTIIYVKLADNNQFSCMVFCDVSKAFDRVWLKGLLFQIERIRFRRRTASMDKMII